MATEVKLNSTTSRCTNWAQIEWNVNRGMVFYALSHKLKGQRMWVLSHVGYDFSNAWTDDFYRMLDAAQNWREMRYMEGGAKDELEDIGYIIAHAGNPIIAVRRNGEILVNEKARAGGHQGAKALARLEPLLRSALTARPNLFNN